MHLNVTPKTWQTSSLRRTDVKTFCGDAFGQINLSVAEFRSPEGGVSIRQNTFFVDGILKYGRERKETSDDVTRWQSGPRSSEKTKHHLALLSPPLLDTAGSGNGEGAGETLWQLLIG